MADNRIRVAAEIAQGDAGTDWLQLRGQRNFFDISVAGSFVATVYLQRKRPGESASDARDVESYTAGTEKIGEMQGHWDVRLFVKNDNHTSGTVKAELGT